VRCFDLEILDSIPVNISLKDVLDELHIKRKPPSIEKSIIDLIERAKHVVRPKILYKTVYIEANNDNSIRIDGLEITSTILRMYLNDGDIVFPHIITSGIEVETVDIPKDNYLKKLLFDGIKELALETAVNYFETFLKEKYGFKTVSAVNPGAPNDWPVSQQKELFSIFGNVEELIGVRLTDNFVMDPIKSLSGIYFSTDLAFMNCRLCLQERCVKRKAGYDKSLAEKYNNACISKLRSSN
jgi:hypothetical protein